MTGAVINPVALPPTRVQDGRSPSASRQPLPLPAVLARVQGRRCTGWQRWTAVDESPTAQCPALYAG
ncbi:hypothetical protein [Amycolatopsis pigmentata]|uniref:Uncharacterized protein n=1 Tax=Amycolatopsis pigmentata TaxID=450801 RepID=A0ABW5FIZ4_9PSEU